MSDMQVSSHDQGAVDSLVAQVESQRYVTLLEHHAQKDRVWEHPISISEERQKPVAEEPRGGTEPGGGRTKVKRNGAWTKADPLEQEGRKKCHPF